MTPMHAATTDLLAGSLRELLHGGRDLGPALAELGWDEVLADDPAGATTLLFVEHGRALATSRALDDVVLRELAGVLPPASGTRAVLHPLGEPVAGRAHGVLLGSLDGIDEVVVPAGAATLLVVPADRLAPITSAAAGFDPRSGWSVVDGPLTGHHEPVPAGDAWTAAVGAAHRALAAEIIGVGEAALAVAVAHTSARQQFGRPIASFQAVRHRLAEAHVVLTAARSVLDAAWTAPDPGWAAALAKLQAGRAQAAVMRSAVQVSGAMGLSQEGEVPRHVTRAGALDALYGGHVALACSTGEALLAGAPLDPVVEV
ncbi:MAG: hypothetical protein QOF00_6536 [Pseudonocardiales bacterium]|nr:hypothetical protein [Pseudonocardiales bacterium]